MKSSKFGERMKAIFNRKRFVQFLDRQGFYIVLFICVAIIGGTAIWTSRNNYLTPNKENAGLEEMAQEEQEQTVDTNTTEGDSLNIQVQDKDKASAAQDTAAKTDTAAGNKDTAAKTVSTTAKAAPSVPKLVKPVDGKIIQPFAKDSLIYSKTLEQWMTHKGIDIAAKEGSEVKAALGGVVEKVVKDATMGNMITLTHGNGLKTVYANLATLDLVKAGQKVERGQVISAVGKTAAFEIMDEAHVHFEVILNGKYMDPEKSIIE